VVFMLAVLMRRTLVDPAGPAGIRAV
jgi:hypothetical protein